MAAVKPIPEGYHTVTPVLVSKDAAGLIDFIKRAFGAEETERFSGPDNRVLHAEVRIGDSIIMLGEACGEDAASGSFYLHVGDVDAAYERALSAGAISVAGPADQFYGSRVARLTDPSGNRWAIATHKEDVPPAELQRRFEALMAQQGAGA